MTLVSLPETHCGDGPLRERAGILAAVAADAARARAGSGRLTLLRGATGTGRSALLDAVVARARTDGMRVLRARCSAQDAGSEFAAVLRLLESEGEYRDEMGHRHPAAGGPAHAPDHRDRFSRVGRLLRSYADDTPLLLAVDDVHLADDASRRWLAEAARRLDRLPVLIVATERSQYDIAPGAPGIAHALSPGLVRVHTLAPLSRAATASLVRDRLGPHTPDAWVDGCVRASAGSPLLLRALLDDLSSPTYEGTRAGLPDSCAELYPGAFAAAVAWWLESAGPATAAVARALAELCGPSGPSGLPGFPGPAAFPAPAEGVTAVDGREDVALLAAVTGADPARVSGWVTAMLRLGLLRDSPVPGGVRFAHPLLRDAVLNGWPLTQRQAAHREAAVFRHRRGDPADAVAGHLLRTAAVATAWAVDALLDAAAGALRAGRSADAVVLLRRALDEPMSRERRAEVLTELGSLEFASVPNSGIPRLAEALRLREQPRDRVQATVTLGSALARRGDPHAAIALLRRLTSDGAVADDPVLGRSVRLASALVSDHDRQIRRDVYDELRDAAERSPARTGPAEQALLVRYEATAGLVSAEEALRRVRALLTAPEDPLALPYLLGTAATVAQWADALDDADRLVRSGLGDHRLSPLHPMHQSLRDTRLDTAMARGRYADVITLLADRDAAPDRAASQGPTNLEAQGLIALVETGRLAEAERLAARVDVGSAADSWEVNRFLYARGTLRAATGDLERALDDFLACGRRQTAREVLSPVVTPWRSSAAECLLALGSPQSALPLAEAEYRLAAVWNTPRVLGRALHVLGAASSGRRGEELSSRAVDLLRDTPYERELVAALIARGRRLTAAGRREQARRLLREAAGIAERLGAARLLDLAGQALDEGGARRRASHSTGAGALTESETRIAGLAAAGKTNAEIAELLHLARRTVETHLTNTYRKLGIRRRADLPAALGTPTPPGPRPYS